jgi:hypothetical protein
VAKRRKHLALGLLPERKHRVGRLRPLDGPIFNQGFSYVIPSAVWDVAFCLRQRRRVTRELVNRLNEVSPHRRRLTESGVSARLKNS